MNIGKSFTPYQKKTHFDRVKAVAFAKSDGFSAFEFSLLVTPADTYFKISRDIVKIKDMVFSVHANHIDTNIASINEDIRRTSVEQVKTAIQFAKRIDSKIVVVHPGIYNRKIYEQDAYFNLYRSLDELLPFAKKWGVNICIENMEDSERRLLTTLHQISRILDRYDGLKFAFDVTHAAKNDPNTYREYYKRFEPKIMHIQISGLKKSRQPGDVPLGLSELDFTEFIKDIKDYPGILRLESNDYETNMNSFRFLKNILSKIAMEEPKKEA